MISLVSTDLSGRKLDLSLFPSASGPGTTLMEIPGSTPKVTAGRLKAAQNYVRLLLTPLGTWRGDPLAGSGFSTKFLNGTPFAFDQIPSTFAAESLSVIEFMASNWALDTPADERISSVSLTSYEALAGVLVMKISITFVDGAGTELILPVRTGGMLG